MVNIPHINLIIDDIRAQPEHFDMSEWGTEWIYLSEPRVKPCGSLGCIAGFCWARMPSDSATNMRSAGEWLGLSKEDDFEELFTGGTEYWHWAIALDIAITTLERLRDTGEVTWGKVKSS